MRQVRSAVGSVAAALGLVGLGVVVTPAPAGAVPPTCTWTGAASTDMNVAGNWSGCAGGAPSSGSNDVLVFPSIGSTVNQPSDSNMVANFVADSIQITGENNGVAWTVSGTSTLVLTPASGTAVAVSGTVGVPSISAPLSFVPGSGSSIAVQVAAADTLHFAGPISEATASDDLEIGLVPNTGTVYLGAVNNGLKSMVTLLGTLDVTNSGAFGSSSGVNVYSGSTVDLIGNLTIPASINIPDLYGTLETTDSSGTDTWGGGIIPTGAGLTSSIAADPGATLRVNGVIGGGVGATVAAGASGFTGTVVLPAIETYGGPTDVAAGTLVAHALPPGTALTVSAGATYDIPGVAQTIGSLAGVGAGSTLQFDLWSTTTNPPTPPGLAQLTVASGTLGVSGAMLDPTFPRGSTTGDSYDIVVNQTGNPVTGSFASPADVALPEGSTFAVGGRTLLITYSGGASGHDVVLTDVTGLTTFDTATSASPGGSASASAGGVTAVASGGKGTVLVGTYAADPVGALPNAVGHYFDVSLSGGNSFTSVVVTDCNLGGGTGLSWWSTAGGGAWVPVVGNPGPTLGPGPCLTVTIGTSPGLSDLTGTVFGLTGGTQGYRLAGADGGVFDFGTASYFGSRAGQPLNAPVVGIAATPDGNGYWLVAKDGGVFAYGDAGFYGSNGGQAQYLPTVGMAATPDGKGYFEVWQDGTVFGFGDAVVNGSLNGVRIAAPVVGIVDDGLGAYWLVGADGGVYAFGAAPYLGSMGGKALNAAVAGMAPTHDAKGYWLVAGDGEVFPFGDAVAYGSPAGSPLNAPVNGIVATPDGAGYWLVAGDGGVFAYGDAAYLGSMGGTRLNAAIVGSTT